MNGKNYQLTLENVLYILNNPQNLILLWHWDKAGGTYTGGQGILWLVTESGDTIAIGMRISNHLYKLQNFTIIKPGTTPLVKPITSSLFNTIEPAVTWEVWHKRMGHLSMAGLKTLYNKHLVDGFNVDASSQKFDCEACTQAKQHVEPFPKDNYE